MKFTFVERKVKPSDDVKNYAIRKISKLDRFFGEEAEANITFSTQRELQVVELTVVHSGMVFRAEKITSDLYASIDGVVNGIERQIRKNKSKLEKRLRKGAFEREILVSPEEEILEEEYEVIRHKKIPLKPMAVDEAILQMNMLGHEFFVFKNAQNNDSHSVIYRRAAGGYGLIEDDQ